MQDLHLQTQTFSQERHPTKTREINGTATPHTPETWATRKGGAFRDNPAQMHAHCDEVVKDPAFAFRGASFSYGDKYIADCAAMAESPSNLSRWKDVTINHHITTVVDDLATLFGTP